MLYLENVAVGLKLLGKCLYSFLHLKLRDFHISAAYIFEIAIQKYIWSATEMGLLIWFN